MVYYIISYYIIVGLGVVVVRLVRRPRGLGGAADVCASMDRKAASL